MLGTISTCDCLFTFKLAVIRTSAFQIEAPLATTSGALFLITCTLARTTILWWYVYHILPQTYKMLVNAKKNFTEIVYFLCSIWKRNKHVYAYTASISYRNVKNGEISAKKLQDFTVNYMLLKSLNVIHIYTRDVEFFRNFDSRFISIVNEFNGSNVMQATLKYLRLFSFQIFAHNSAFQWPLRLQTFKRQQ